MSSTLAVFYVRCLSLLSMAMEIGLPPKLPSLAGVNLSLTDTGASSLAFSVLSSRRDGDEPRSRPDGIPD